MKHSLYYIIIQSNPLLINEAIRTLNIYSTDKYSVFKLVQLTFVELLKFVFDMIVFRCINGDGYGAVLLDFGLILRHN